MKELLNFCKYFGKLRSVRVSIISVGRMKAGPERQLVERYQTRARATGRGLGFSGFDMVEIPESRGRREVDRQLEEMNALLARAENAHMILFDERFPSPASTEFFGKIGLWKDNGIPHVACLLGGPDGVAPSLRNRAHWGISFGRFSLPHQLARILVFEQLYRAMTLLAGHPYHRAGQD